MLKKLPDTPDGEDLQGENEISLFLKDVKCIGGLSWARLRSAQGTCKNRSSSSPMVVRRLFQLFQAI